MLQSQITQKMCRLFPPHIVDSIPSNIFPTKPFIKMKKMTEIDDSLLILTHLMSLNISFTSPILQSVQFLEQYHKYSLRSILSQFPISLTQFDTYYNQIQNSIMIRYKKSVTKISKILYQLINLANCQKINSLKMYTQLFQELKDKLLLKRHQTDVYGFNDGQFQQDLQNVKKMTQFCQNYLNLNNWSELEIQNKQKIKKEHQNFRIKVKQQIEKLTNKIKSQSIAMMDKMNDCRVEEPYKPQNEAYQLIDFPNIIQSCYKKVLINNIEIDQNLQRRHFSMQKQLRKMFEQGLKQQRQSKTNYIRELIEAYNKDCLSKKAHNVPTYFTYSISPPIIDLQKRRRLDVHEMHNMNFSNGNDTKPAIVNVYKQIKFDRIINFFDCENQTQQAIQLTQIRLPFNSSKKFDNQQTDLDISFDLSVSVNPFYLKKMHVQQKIINLSKQIPKKSFYQYKNTFISHEDNIKRLQVDFHQYKQKKQQKNKIQLSTDTKNIFNKNIYVEKNFFVNFLFNQQSQLRSKKKQQLNELGERSQTPNNPFQNKKINNVQVKDESPILNHQQGKHEYLYFKNHLQKSQAFENYSNLPQSEISRIEDQSMVFQTQKKVQYERRLESVVQLLETKNYVKFCSLSINPKTKKGGLDTNTFISGELIYRYGLQIKTKWQNYMNNQQHTQKPSIIQHQNSNPNSINASLLKLTPPILQILNKFFFYYFKERFFRQNKHIQDNSEIPLLMTLQSQKQFLNQKMIKKIIILIKKFQFFILWTLNDIILYQERLQFGERKGLITIHIFSTTDTNSTGLIWQLRKRLDQKFKNQQNPSKQQSNRTKPNKFMRYTFEQKLQYQFIKNKQKESYKQTIFQILSKIQCVHRILYKRHKKPLSLQKSIEKAKQLWDQILLKRIMI